MTSTPRFFPFAPRPEQLRQAIEEFRPFLEVLRKQHKNKPDSCWEWPTEHLKVKYGLFRGIPTHRLAWMSVNGLIPQPTPETPKRLVVRHLCDNPPCVNPAHLAIGTYSDNMRDRSGKRLLKDPAEILAEMQRKSEAAKIASKRPKK